MSLSRPGSLKLDVRRHERDTLMKINQMRTKMRSIVKITLMAHTTNKIEYTLYSARFIGPFPANFTLEPIVFTGSKVFFTNAALFLELFINSLPRFRKPMLESEQSSQESE